MSFGSRSLVSLVEQNAKSRPSDIFAYCCDAGRGLTWHDFWFSAQAFAAHIPEEIPPQSVVLIPCFADVDIYPLLVACWLRRLIPCPVNPGAHASEIAALSGDLPPGAWIFSMENHRENAERISRLSSFPIWHVAAAGAGAELVEGTSVKASSSSDYSLLMATSGSTGAPKLLLFREEEVLGGIEILRSGGSYHTGRLLNLRPQFTTAGLYPMWPSFYENRAIFLSAKALGVPRAESFFSLLEAHRPDDVSAPVAYMRSIARTMTDRMMNSGSSYGGILLRIVGQRASVSEIQDVMRVYPFRLAVRYAMTECIHTLCARAAVPEDFLSGDGFNVGRPLPGFSMRAEGRVRIRSRGMSHATIKSGGIVPDPADAWRETDDEGEFRPDGSLFLLGRGPSWICSGGLRFSGHEVEAVLSRHGSVMDAAVLAVPDEKTGEVPFAFLTIRPGGDEASLVAEVRDLCFRELPPRKIPAGFLVVPEIPQNAAGKRDWKRLREMWGALQARSSLATSKAE